MNLVDGEVFVKGPSVFARYWGREEATRLALVDGWFRTGDIGSIAADGYVTLTGRKSGLIIAIGFNIYPREIEELLLEQSQVAEVAVAGQPDAVKGEVPVACIVATGACGVSELERKLPGGACFD